MNTKRAFGVVTVVMAAALILTSCSPMDWSARQLPDGSQIEKGSQVTITDKNGESYMGIYTGMESNPTAEYVERYASESGSDDSVLPRIGERVFITTSLSTEKLWEGTFVGFDEKSLWVQANGEPNDVFVSSLYRLVDSRGHVLQRMNLRKMFVEGNIPLMTTLVLETGNKTIRVPINDIQELTVFAKGGDEKFASQSMNGNQFRASLME